MLRATADGLRGPSATFPQKDKTMNDGKSASVKLGGTTFLESFDLMMMIPGTNEPTGWVVTLAGPAHPQSQALFDRQSRKSNKKSAAIEMAQVNGKKWKGDDDRLPAEIRRETISNIVSRIVTWSPAPDFEDGKGPIEFSEDAAIDLFLEPSKGGYLKQVVDYFDSEKAFLKASAKP
jgi:hypothetical protein